MKNRGLTLVELVAVLVILSIIALIVTPTVTGSIREYKEEMYATQIESIKGAAYNWGADNIDKLQSKDECSSYSIKILLKELQDGGYIDDNLKNHRDGGVFDPNNVFVLVDCEIKQDATGQYKDNYKYNYGVYLNDDEYISSMAINYVKNNNIQLPNTVTSGNLNIKNIKTTSGIDVNISFVSVNVNKDNNTYNTTVNK